MQKEKPNCNLIHFLGIFDRFLLIITIFYWTRQRSPNLFHCALLHEAIHPLLNEPINFKPKDMPQRRNCQKKVLGTSLKAPANSEAKPVWTRWVNS